MHAFWHTCWKLSERACKKLFLELYTNIHLATKCTKVLNEGMVVKKKAPVSLDYARSCSDEKIGRLLKFRNNTKMSWKMSGKLMYV